MCTRLWRNGIALVMALTLMWLPLFASPARAETAETATYQGEGIVSRRASRALLEELTLAYVKDENTALRVGQAATWTICATGGDGVYQYQFYIWRQDFAAASSQYTYAGSQAYSSANAFTFTPAQAGRYFLTLDVRDDSGNALSFQSAIYMTVQASDAGDPTTVYGKVKQLAAQCRAQAGSSDFSRALWLHDWLTHNADYDTTYTEYQADGVLLKGTGVCQSYALAYGMLLDEIGIENLYVSGVAGGGGHAWNLVRMGGEWYHVDCTWDDPVGGSPGRAYFGLTDALLAQDHTWTGGAILPACQDMDCNYNARVGNLFIHDADTLGQAVRQGLQSKWTTITLVSDGTVPGFHAFNALKAWLAANTIWSYGVTGLSYSGGALEAKLTPTYGSGGVTDVTAIIPDATELTLEIGETYRLSAVFQPSYASSALTLTSARPAVVSVAGNVLTAVSSGTALITLTASNGVKATCTVIVPGGEPVCLLVIPASMQVIEAEAFANCAAIEEVRVTGRQLTAINSRAFANCTALTRVVLPDTVTSIAEDAFTGCDKVAFACPQGSVAYAYAQSHSIPIVP